MPYLPSKRFRPARAGGNYNPTASAGFSAEQYDDWLDEMLGDDDPVGSTWPSGNLPPPPPPPPSGGGGGNYPPRDQAQEYLDAIRQGVPGAIGPNSLPTQEAPQRPGFGAGGFPSGGPAAAWESLMGGFGDVANWFGANSQGLQNFFQPQPAQSQEGDLFYPGGGGLNQDWRDFIDGFGNFVLPGTGAGGGTGPYPGAQGPNIEGAPNFLDTLGALFGDVPRQSMAENRASTAEWAGNFFPASRFDPKSGIMGMIQEFAAPSPRARDYTTGAGFMGAGLGEVANWLADLVLPGTANIPHATTTDRPGQGSYTTLEPGQSVTDAYGIERVPTMPGPPFRNAYTGRESYDSEGRLIAHEWDKFWDSLAPNLDTTGPVPPSSYGAGGGGGGGFGGFDFAPGDPADPRFWLDMVRWLI